VRVHRAKGSGTHRARRGLPIGVSLAVLAGAVVAGAVVAGVLVSDRAPRRHHRARGRVTVPVPAPNSRPPSAPAVDRAVCPLTGTPAPGDKVPERPALAIKVGNNPGARPQSGLSEADVVFEVPIEGAITRLIAVYQCGGAPQVGPVRSTRWIDTQLLEQLGHPIFGFAGGINPDRSLVASSPLFDADYFRYYDLYTRSSARLAPNNLYVSTAALWGLDHSRTPPRPLFHYSTTSPSGNGVQKVGQADLTYSGILEVTWQWDPAVRKWLRLYGTSPADGASGNQLSATNVVIERVQTVPGPYVEDAEGAVGVHSITVGQGPVTVLRDGLAVSGTWERSSIEQTTELVTQAGKPIALAPGNTWVELVPTTSEVSLTSS